MRHVRPAPSGSRWKATQGGSLQIAQASLCAFNLHADAKCTSTQLPSPIYGQLEDLGGTLSSRAGNRAEAMGSKEKEDLAIFSLGIT
mmetsp:Transcript_8797/g.18685  ORF Transcript_8797/g.18685 Transcript_8797/m.18685 type:complete len:87 (+) Transcript_8797:190-450(+)